MKPSKNFEYWLLLSNINCFIVIFNTMPFDLFQYFGIPREGIFIVSVVVLVTIFLVESLLLHSSLYYSNMRIMR